MTSAAPRFICFLCKRKFTSAQLLQRHKQLSDLHASNSQKQEDEIQQQKEDLRQCIASYRKQISDAEIASKVQDVQSHKSDLEAKLQQVLGEYGQVQEKLEGNRYQRAADRGVEGDKLLRLNTVQESTAGRLLLSAGAATWQGNKDVQEDRYMLDMKFDGPEGRKIVGFCVLDGHSGSLCVEALMDWLPNNIQKCLATKTSISDENMRQAITEACILTDDEFLSRARERELLDGSTGLLCLIYPLDSARPGGDGATIRHKMLLANIGDSRAVLCKSLGGKLIAARLTDDHKPGRVDERRRIEARGGVVDMQGVWRVFTPGPANFGGRCMLWGLAVSRAFGDLLMKEPQRYGCAGASGELVSAVPEIHTYEINPSDDRFLILACDGIWDVISDEEAVQVCSEHSSAGAAAHALIQHSFQVGSDDNLTALVIAWQPAPDGDQNRPNNQANLEQKKQRID